MMACESGDELRIVPCTTARILEMKDVREEQQVQLSVTLPLVEANLLQIDPDWSRCAVDAFQAAPVAAWGAFPQWSGRAIAWALFTPRASNHAMRVRNATMFHVEQLQQREHLRRLEATVEMTDSVALRWAQVMGFRPEGLLRSYGPNGEDYLMMARVWV
jgi:hypothetical protein